MQFFDKIFSQFGAKKEVQSELVNNEEESFAQVRLDDTYLTMGGMVANVLHFDSALIDENTQITKWRELARTPEISWAIQEVCNDAIIADNDAFPCDVVKDSDSEISDKIMEKLSEEFRTVLRLMNFKRDGNEIFKQWYIDGKQYFHGVLDPKRPKKGLLAVRWVDPRNMKRVVELEEYKDANGFPLKRVKEDYYIYNPAMGYKTNFYVGGYGGSSGAEMAIKVNPESIAYSNSGIFFERGDGSNVSLSHLDIVLKPYNMMSALENAMTIYRIARAPERRIFYVDVGNLPKDKANQYLSDVMGKFKRKLTFDSVSGEVKGENNEMNIMDDYWLPRKEGGRGTEVTTLQSGSAWSDLSDLEWWQKKVLRSMNVPFGRYQSDNMFTSGRSMEITREEVKFAKFISNLRNKFGQGLIQLLKIQVISKGIMTQQEFERIQNEIVIKWKTDAYWDEMLFNEVWQTRLQMLQGMDAYVGKFFSQEWIKKNVLQFTDEEIKEMEKQIKAEPKPVDENGMSLYSDANDDVPPKAPPKSPQDNSGEDDNADDE